MEMKNIMIILIFSLAVLGLIIGVYYTEAESNEKITKNSNETIDEDSDNVITINLEPKERNDNKSLT
ncbi:hypothetical protein [Methanobrevibacter sp. YE315]|uniref:hypothetical protein n=1 Tax=Methanobrevibacter sp. YE315 TaxID=1609968 RepID=UPI000B22E27E|nr:hypothetical protein [Methanobrevibacter sp. YE315]